MLLLPRSFVINGRQCLSLERDAKRPDALDFVCVGFAGTSCVKIRWRRWNEELMEYGDRVLPWERATKAMGYDPSEPTLTVELSSCQLHVHRKQIITIGLVATDEGAERTLYAVMYSVLVDHTALSRDNPAYSAWARETLSAILQDRHVRAGPSLLERTPRPNMRRVFDLFAEGCRRLAEERRERRNRLALLLALRAAAE